MLLNYVLRSLLKRFRANVVTILSIALFVAGGSVGIAFYLGLRQKVVDSTPPEHVLVLGRGATAEGGSRLSLDTARKIVLLPGIKTAGTPLAARELLSSIAVSNEGSTKRGLVSIRGIDEASPTVHQARIISGRMPAPGTLEVAIGTGVLEEYPNLKEGTSLTLPGGPAPIVGTFTAPASDTNTSSEVWTPRSALELHLKAKQSSSLYLVADSAARVPELVAKINDSKDLEADAYSLREYRAAEAGLAKIVRVVLFMIILLSLVAALAIGTTMSAAVSSRMPELAVLVTVGFRRGRLGRLVIAESVLLAAIGSALGLVASFGVAAAIQKYGDIKVDVMTSVLVPVIGLALGFAVGLLGGIGPANTVRRLQIIKYMR